jgi:hypothetical protein
LIGHFGGIAGAVAFDVLEPPRAAFIAVPVITTRANP